MYLCIAFGRERNPNPSAPSPRVANSDMSASSVSALLSSSFAPVKSYRQSVLESWQRLCSWALTHLAGKVGDGFAVSYWYGNSEDWGSEQINRLFVTPEGELQIACYWQDENPDIVMTLGTSNILDNSEARHSLNYPDRGMTFQPVASCDIPWVSREIHHLTMSEVRASDVECLGRLLNAWERVAKELVAHVEKHWQEEPVAVAEGGEDLG